MATIEFAGLLPLFMLMMLGLSDLVQLGRGHMRVQSAAMQIGQIISQCEKFSASDEVVLKELTGRILGTFAENNAQWELRITAFGRDSTNNAINWSVAQSGGTPRAGAPLAVNSKGSQLPVGEPAAGSTTVPTYQMESNRLLFRTEVFALIDRTTLSRALSLFRSGEWQLPLGFDSASAEALHSTRVPNTDSLKAKVASGQPGCLT